MSVDDRENRSDNTATSRLVNKKRWSRRLQSETDEPLPPRAEAIANRDAAGSIQHTPQGRRRRYLTKRNALIATVAASIGVVALILLAVLLYRSRLR